MSEKQITKKTIQEKVDELTVKFDKLNDQIVEKKNEIEKVNNEINTMMDEQKRMQGEYRMLVNLGAEFDLIESEGEISTEENS